MQPVERIGQDALVVVPGDREDVITALAELCLDPDGHPNKPLGFVLSGGYRPSERTLETIRTSGTALLLVEQHVHHALAIADDAIVLAKGEVAYSGPVSELGDVQARVLGGNA